VGVRQVNQAQLAGPANPVNGIPTNTVANVSVRDLPLGNHDGVLGKVTNGWSVAGATVAQDGQPLTIENTRGGSIYGFGALSPITSTARFAAGEGAANVATPGSVADRLGGSVLGGRGYFNKAAFGTTPVIGNRTGYGNSGFGILLGPGQFNFDGTINQSKRPARGCDSGVCYRVLQPVQSSAVCQPDGVPDRRFQVNLWTDYQRVGEPAPDPICAGVRI